MCERGCGFEGAFDVVSAHEKTCTADASASKTGGSGSAGDVYICDRGCGFEGSFDEVTAHEAGCEHVRPLEFDSDMGSEDEADFLHRCGRQIAF